MSRYHDIIKCIKIAGYRIEVKKGGGTTTEKISMMSILEDEDKHSGSKSIIDTGWHDTRPRGG